MSNLVRIIYTKKCGDVRRKGDVVVVDAVKAAGLFGRKVAREYVDGDELTLAQEVAEHVEEDWSWPNGDVDTGDNDG